MWYYIKQQSFYDRDWITIDTFITQDPDDFKDNDTYRYVKEPIMVK